MKFGIICVVASERAEAMPPIETIARPHKNRISVAVPREYGTCSFQVILFPLGQELPVVPSAARRPARRRKNFVETLLSSPRLADGDALDISRDASDFGRDIAL